MFRYCLNTGTISGQKLSLVDELKTASKAGFDSVEPWMREIHEYRKTNGSLKPLRECVAELGLSVESAIGFGKWAVEDDAERRAGLDEVRRDMEALAELGGKRLACDFHRLIPYAFSCALVTASLNKPINLSYCFFTVSESSLS